MQANLTEQSDALCAAVLQLQRRFGRALMGVEIATASGMPLAGLACGNRVVIDEGLLDQDPRILLQVLAHEVAHVIQQRREGFTPSGRIGAFAFNCCPLLEAEAERVALRVIDGDMLEPEFTAQPSGSRPIPGVTQFLIVVNGNRIGQASDLSANFRSTVKLIADGEDWLASALPASGPVYSAASEADLTNQVQFGLHEWPLLSFPGLQLPPSMLVGMVPADLDLLLANFNKPPFTPASMSVLARYGILTSYDLADVTELLGVLGVSESFPEQGPSFTDQLALYNAWFAGGAGHTPTAADQPAASFAVMTAAGPSEFLPAFSFYRYIAFLMPGADASTVTSTASGLWKQLAPRAIQFLRCLLATPGAPADQISNRLSMWLNQGNILGFQTAAAAIWNLAGSGQAVAGLKMAEPGTIDAYIVAAQRFLSAAQLTQRRSQDGVNTFYYCSGPGGVAELRLDPAGCIAFAAFRPLQANPAS